MSKLYHYLYFLVFCGISLQGFAQKIYWTESGHVRVADLTSTSIANTTTLLNFAGVTNIALDPASQVIYYSDIESIHTANLIDGSSQALVIDKFAMSGYQDIAYSGSQSALYASGVSGDDGAFIINGDGTYRSLNMKEKGRSKFLGVAAYDGNEAIYFVNQNDNVIYETDLEGNTASVIITGGEGEYIEYVTVDNQSDMLYYTTNNSTSGKYTIYSYNILTTERTPIFTSDGIQITSIQSYAKLGKLYYVKSGAGIYQINNTGTENELLVSGSIDDVAILADVTPPAIVELSPSNNAVNVTTATSSLILTFSENVKLSSTTGKVTDKSIRLVRASDQTSLSLSGISISGHVVTVTAAQLALGLNNNEKYIVLIGNKVFSDFSNNDFGGIALNTGWDFVTECDVVLVNNQTPVLCESTLGSGSLNGIDLSNYESAITQGAADVSVTWYSNAALNLPIINPINLSILNGTIFYAKATHTTTKCLAVATVTFTIRSLPSTKISGNGSVCANSKGIQYKADGNQENSYTWSVPAGATITSGQGTNTIVVTFGSEGGVVAVVPSLKGGTCVGPSATVNVANHIVLTPTGPKGASYCAGSAVAAISVTTPDSGRKIKWYSTPTGETLASGTTTGTAGEQFTPLTNGTYYAEAYDAELSTCVSSTRTPVLLTVNPLPVVRNKTVVLCESTAGSATAVGIDLTTYESEIVSGATDVAIAWQSSLDERITTPTSVSVQNASFFYAVVTNATTQCVASATVTFTINPLPAIASITGSTRACSLATNISYQANGAASAYTWGVPPDASILTGQGTNSIVISFGTSSGVVQVTPSNGPACVGNPVTQTVTVDPPLKIYAIKGGGNFCAGGTGLTLRMTNADAAVKYELYRENITTGTIVTAVGGGFDFPVVTHVGVYTVKAFTSPTCQADMTGTAIVTQVSTPTGSGVISGNIRACSGSTEIYTVSGFVGATDFQWSLQSGIDKISVTDNGIVVKTNGSGNISVVASNECGAATPVTQFITVLQKPTVSIEEVNTTIFVNDHVEFSLSTSASSPVISWTFGDGNTSLLSDPENTYASSGDFDVHVEVKDNTGCFASDTKTVRVVEDPGLTDDSIKNLITANDDSKNDFLYIDRIEKYPNNEVTLVDRWGVEVFKAKSYNNTWDLKEDGEYLPSGNYICIVKLGESGKVIKRTISVVKGR